MEEINKAEQVLYNYGVEDKELREAILKEVERRILKMKEKSLKIKKRYYISIDLNQAGIEARNEEEAIKEARKLIKSGCYSLNIVDEEEV